MNAATRADVCIVGGGLLGVSTAYFASRAGLRVVLLEERELASGASGAAFGGVSVSIYSYASARVPAHYVALSAASLELYHGLSRDLGPPLDFVVPGSLDPFEDERVRPSRRERADSLKAEGVPVELLDGDAAREVEPALSAAVAGASYCSVDGHVTPPNVVWALADAARASGTEIRVGARAEEILVERGRAVGVRVGGERIFADRVVDTAGAGSAELARTAGIEIPLAFSRGQMFVTERVPPLLRTYLHSVKQTLSGTIVIGATREPDVDDVSTTATGMRDMLAEAVRLVPALAQLRLLRSWAGVRPVPRDGYPVIGPVDGIENLLVGVMHRGVTLAPVVGKLLAELVQGQRPSLDVKPYALSRFAGVEEPGQPGETFYAKNL